jgi:arsenate reductase-like glutaredoxin family protein
MSSCLIREVLKDRTNLIEAKEKCTEVNMAIMNIQIFGTKKCNDTKKAQRYFKERGITFQFIDMSEKEISKGEFRSVCQAVGGINAMINEDCKDKDALALVKYISEDQKEEKLLVNQQVIKTPIVRNGKQATVGYAPEIWKGWS